MRNNENAYNYLGLTFRQQTEYKETIRRRDSYTCQKCGASGYDVDHIIPWHISKDSSPSNLRTLCHRCNIEDRELVLPEGSMQRLPLDDWWDYIKTESDNSASQD